MIRYNRNIILTIQKTIMETALQKLINKQILTHYLKSTAYKINLNSLINKILRGQMNLNLNIKIQMKLKKLKFNYSMKMNQNLNKIIKNM